MVAAMPSAVPAAMPRRLETLEKELAQLKEEDATMRAQWEGEKNSISDRDRKSVV